MILWKNVLDALNPTLCCRRYEVCCTDRGGGRTHHFWTRRRAEACFETQVASGAWSYVYLEDSFVGDPPEPSPLDTPGVKYLPLPRRLRSKQLRQEVRSWPDGAFLGYCEMDGPTAGTAAQFVMGSNVVVPSQRTGFKLKGDTTE